MSRSHKPDYTLHYWPVPFRGHFIRAILAHAGQSVEEPDGKGVSDVKELAPDKQPWPFMGPPMLVDNADGSALAQMSAIAFYLGEKHALMPKTAIDRARAIKIVNDANDVIDETTLEGGVYRLWDEKLWKEFVPRLERWMAIFEATGAHYKLTADKGFMLGTAEPTIADIVTATLWGTMTREFDVIAKMFEKQAPAVAGLVRRVNALPKMAAFVAESDKRFGGQYCGGQIEKSLRAVAK